MPDFNDLPKMLRLFEQGGTVENPKLILRQAIAEIEEQRRRNGQCFCNAGPDTDGPDEFCPWHGRTYAQLLEIIDERNRRIDGLERGLIDCPHCLHPHLRHEDGYDWYVPCPWPECSTEHTVGGKCWITAPDG